jgi:type II secretory pathway pseudopilin PulG
MSRSRISERGFTLAGLIVIMTIVMIVVAYTVPRQWSKVMQRERDYQTLFVMKQYARAILEYQKKHAGLPTSLDQLKDARKPRFVRGTKAEWPDPLTGEVDWILIPPQAPGQPAAGPTTNQFGNLSIGGYRDAPASTTGTSGTSGTDTSGTSATGKPAKAAANKDYVGPFVGVRPNKTGKSFLSVNSAENYEDWSYTVQDLTAEINARAASATVK